MPDRAVGGRGRVLAGAAAAAVAVAALSAAALLVRTGAPVAVGADVPDTTSHLRPTPPPSLPPAPRAPWQPGAPRRVVIPSLGVDARTVPVVLRGSTLVAPQDPQVLGWWADGALPGADTGSALVAGHTVHSGGGALDALETVRVGARVVVRTDGRSLSFRVVRVQVLDKAALARTAETLFAQDVAGRLVLLTCEDWDGSGFRSNVVVTAVPSGR